MASSGHAREGKGLRIAVEGRGRETECSTDILKI
jgi:hypothetical protein